VIEAGLELGPTSWLEVTQERIDAFAAATEDGQAIHVDPELAAQGPYGMTIAHGFLTLSLLIPFWNELFEREGVTVNYGLNRVRFPAPVPAGSRIRAGFRVEAFDGRRATILATVEREGGDKPVCVAELLLLFV